MCLYYMANMLLIYQDKGEMVICCCLFVCLCQNSGIGSNDKTWLTFPEIISFNFVNISVCIFT